MTSKRADFSESTGFIELMFKDKLKRHLKTELLLFGLTN